MHRDLSPVKSYDLTGKRQSQTTPGLVLYARVSTAEELGEEPRQVLDGDTDAGIPYVDMKFSFPNLDLHRYLAPLGRILRRIANQIDQNHAQLVLVQVDFGKFCRH